MSEAKRNASAGVVGDSIVIPAQAGIFSSVSMAAPNLIVEQIAWIPACAGMTVRAW